jgi:hypothetical protein
VDLDRKHDADWYRKQQGQQPHHGLIAQCHHGREPLWFPGTLHWLGKLRDFQVLAADRGCAGAREGWCRQSSASQASGGQLRPRAAPTLAAWVGGLPDLLTFGCTMQFTRSSDSSTRASRSARCRLAPPRRPRSGCLLRRARQKKLAPSILGARRGE